MDHARKIDAEYDGLSVQAILDQARWLYDQAKAAPNRFGIGESPGAEADLRLMTACIAAVREGLRTGRSASSILRGD